MPPWEKKLLARIEQDITSNRLIFPSLPEVALRVRRLTEDENCTPAKLEKEIAKDAAIAARLIKVANSSAMRSGRPVTSLKQAITRLGLSLVRTLVTQLSILQSMNRCRDPQRLRGFVASGLKISALCHALAQRQKHLDPEQAALAGLLHDIGKLPLRQFLGNYPKARDNERLCQHLEQRLHPRVGAMLLSHWQLPRELVQVAGEHEETGRDSGKRADYTDVVIAANLLHYGTAKGRYAHLDGVSVPALEKCRPADGGAISRQCDQRMELSRALLSA